MSRLSADKPPIMTFRHHERIMFNAQRAEARGEFRDLLAETPTEAAIVLGNLSLHETEQDTLPLVSQVKNLEEGQDG